MTGLDMTDQEIADQAMQNVHLDDWPYGRLVAIEAARLAREEAAKVVESLSPPTDLVWFDNVGFSMSQAERKRWLDEACTYELQRRILAHAAAAIRAGGNP